jgi:hypothetical protein
MKRFIGISGGIKRRAEPYTRTFDGDKSSGIKGIEVVTAVGDWLGSVI